ncbi:MAG: hypothetical protein BGO11_19500 [Solirubrobacterales bacterium 70-9]|nr:MAG: hypothetical protein BGO11_19500 [Solirubrobacterales bacterium 70-9]
MEIVKTHHIGIAVPSRDAALAEAEALGFGLDMEFDAAGPELEAGNDLPGASMLLAFCSGPAGSLELIEHRFAGDPTVRGPGEPGHAKVGLAAKDGGAKLLSYPIEVELERPAREMELTWTSPDPARTAKTLGHLGLHTEADPDGGMLARREDLVVRLIPADTDDPSAPPRPNDMGRVHLCFEVVDMDQAHAELIAAGIDFVSPPLTHAESGLSWVYFRDPGGVGEIELLHMPA